MVERVHFGNMPLEGERVRYSTDYPGTVPVGGTGPGRHDVVVITLDGDQVPYEVPQGAYVEVEAVEQPVPAAQPAADVPAEGPEGEEVSGL
jgi:hypothetical protein